MPLTHQLPVYAQQYPTYGQNLVHLAQALASGTPLGVVDVGANIGDSAAQILNKVDARIVCVEADPEYLPYLERNVGGRCVIEPVLLVADPADAEGLGAVRQGGTTRFAPGGASVASAVLPVAKLSERYPDVRLIKSDTDGYDTTLIPALARAYPGAVLFFEYDPGLTRQASHTPEAVWSELERIGYCTVGVWNNFGHPLHLLDIQQAAQRASILDEPFEDRHYHYWDVAVAHRDDTEGQEALRALIRGTG